MTTLHSPVVRFLAGTVISAALPGAGWARDWDQFRGPSQNGHADAEGLPVAPDESRGVRWKTAIPGKGWSSPVVSGEQVWLTTATEDGTELSVVVLDKNTGKVLRNEVLFRVQNPQFCHKFNSYASPTPVVAGGKVVVSFGSPGTACLDEKTGARLWERTDFVCNHFRGSGSSPVVWNHLVLMHFDGSDRQYAVALDLNTGATVWQADRTVDFKDTNAEGKISGDGDFRKAFATPLVVEHEGVPVFVSSGAKAHYGYDVRTGRELWRFEERAHHSASTRPLSGGDGRVFLQTGFKGHLLALRLGGSGVLEEAQADWRLKKGVPSKPSLLLISGMLFLVDDSGIATCLDAKTGETVWTERVGGNFSASPLYADGKIYACNEEGKVTVFVPERQYRVLGEGRFESGFMASPAAVGNALFLRTKTHMYRVEKE